MKPFRLILASLMLLILSSCEEGMVFDVSFEPIDDGKALVRKAEHVILIGIDGWGSYSWENSDIPVIKSLAENGCYTLNKRAVLPSESAPNWGTMFCGAGIEAHGWLSNSIYVEPNDKDPESGIFPTIFRIMRNQNPDSEIGVVYEWSGIRNHIDYQALNYCIDVDYEQAATFGAEYIKEKKPDLVAIVLDKLDAVGHNSGHGSAEYYEYLKNTTDGQVAMIIDAVKEAGIYDDSVIIVTSDHGGYNNGHGGYTMEELKTPFVIAGKGIRKGGIITEHMTQLDVAPTIAEILGLKTPQSWNGQSMSEIFEQ